MTRTLVGAAEPDEPVRRHILNTGTSTGSGMTATSMPVTTTGNDSRILFLELIQTHR